MNSTVPLLLNLSEVLYTLCNIALVIFGINSLILSVIYVVNHKWISGRKTPAQLSEWPMVTIQLPIYNERYLVDKLLATITRLDYPIDRLQIQVLDDSTDFTSDLLRRLVKRYQNKGFNVQYLHRADRTGYKAGNLASGLPHATGELIAIFDADFRPARDWLKKVVPYFQDPKLGFVQTRWTHLNFRHNIVSLIAGTALNGHYIVEQNARASAGLFCSFTGTAGMWRKAAIEDAGGWHWDTLTEDLDLSFRAQLKGWRGDYIPNAVAGGELPVDMDSFLMQQFRWMKGAAQNARLYLPEVIRARIPLGKKIMACFHLTNAFSFPIMLLLLFLMLPISFWNNNFLMYFWWTAIGTFGPFLLFALAKTEYLPRLIDRVNMIPVLVLIGVGLTVNCSLGIISGLFNRGGEFIRTSRMDPRIGAESRAKKNIFPRLLIYGEAAMGIYMLATVLVLLSVDKINLSLWVITCTLSFFMMVAISIYQQATRRADRRVVVRRQSANV